MCYSDLALNIQFSASISVDATKYTMGVSGFITATEEGEDTLTQDPQEFMSQG